MLFYEADVVCSSQTISQLWSVLKRSRMNANVVRASSGADLIEQLATAGSIRSGRHRYQHALDERSAGDALDARCRARHDRSSS